MNPEATAEVLAKNTSFAFHPLVLTESSAKTTAQQIKDNKLPLYYLLLFIHGPNNQAHAPS
jgi:hypothetical protein